MPYIGNPISDFNVSTAMLNTDSVTSIKIDDGTIVNADINDSAAIAKTKLAALEIVNADVNASAAIAGSKISPTFTTDGSFNSVSIGKGNNSVTACTVLGENALDAANTGNNNTAIGFNVLTDNTSGNACTAVGYQALTLSTGNYNTAIGWGAMKSATSAVDSVALGIGAGDAITTGNYNVCLGSHAGGAITTGNNNVCVGTEAGDSILTGSSNVCVGRYTDPDTNSRDTVVVLGYNVTSHAADITFKVRADNGSYNTQNSSTWSTTSDVRIKKDIVDNTQGLDVINQIRVRNFKYRTPEEIAEGAPELAHLNLEGIAIPKTELQLGAIAQEIEKVLPEVVSDDDNGVKDVNPDRLTWILVNAVKELSAKNDALAVEVEQLKSQLNN